MSLVVRMSGRSNYQIQLQHAYGMDEALDETYIMRPFPSGQGNFLVGYCCKVQALTELTGVRSVTICFAVTL